MDERWYEKKDNLINSYFDLLIFFLSATQLLKEKPLDFFLSDKLIAGS